MEGDEAQIKRKSFLQRKQSIKLMTSLSRWLSGKESAWNTGNLGSIPELGRLPEEGNGNSLQYSCLENPMERGAWQGFSPWGCKSPDLSMTEHARKDNDPLELFNTKTPGLSNQDNVE